MGLYRLRRGHIYAGDGKRSIGGLYRLYDGKVCPPWAVKTLAFPAVNRFGMALLYGRDALSIFHSESMLYFAR